MHSIMRKSGDKTQFQAWNSWEKGEHLASGDVYLLFRGSGGLVEPVSAQVKKIMPIISLRNKGGLGLEILSG